MSVVEDNEENLEICKIFCGPCSIFRENKLMEVPPHALLCARGISEKYTGAFEKGYNCFDCDIFKKYNLLGMFFCIYGLKARSKTKNLFQSFLHFAKS